MPTKIPVKKLSFRKSKKVESPEKTVENGREENGAGVLNPENGDAPQTDSSETVQVENKEPLLKLAASIKQGDDVVPEEKVSTNGNGVVVEETTSCEPDRECCVAVCDDKKSETSSHSGNSVVDEEVKDAEEDSAEVKTGIPVKVKRNSSIKKLLTKRPLSSVFDKSEHKEKEKNPSDPNKPKKSSSFKKKLSFTRKKKDKDSENGANDGASVDPEVDDWRMNGLLNNSMVKSTSLASLRSNTKPITEETTAQTYTIPPIEENAQPLTCTTNEVMETDAANSSTSEEKPTAETVTPTPAKIETPEEALPEKIEVEDSVVVTIQNLASIVKEKKIEMPENIQCNDWLYLNLLI